MLKLTDQEKPLNGAKKRDAQGHTRTAQNRGQSGGYFGNDIMTIIEVSV